MEDACVDTVEVQVRPDSAWHGVGGIRADFVDVRVCGDEAEDEMN